MEIAGLAIGVVGLLTLYQEVANKLHSVKHFSSESLRLTSRYNATKILFERWAKQAVIADTHGSQKTVPPQLNDQATASAAADLLKSIRDVFANSDSTFARYHDQRPNGSDSARLNIRSRLQWAAGDSGKLTRQVEDFDGFVQKLYLLVPVDDLHRDQFWKLQDALFESQRSNTLGRIVRWLDAANSEDSFDAYCSARLDTTCNWFTANAACLDWLSDQLSNSGKVLWIHGPAGFGKSVLCAYIIQLLRDTGKAPVYYSVCSADNESQRSPISILRTWILQAVHRDETVLDMVNNLCPSCYGRYIGGAADFDFSDLCVGHEYLRIPSDKWNVEEIRRIHGGVCGLAEGPCASIPALIMLSCGLAAAYFAVGVATGAMAF